MPGGHFSAVILIQNLGRCDYRKTWEAMRIFTENRNAKTPDEIWMVEHERIFTTGVSPSAPPHPTDIATIKTDRGGKITYHAPGQAVVYCLLDIRRRRLGVRKLVRKMEQAMIDTLHHFAISGARRNGLPGVFVGRKKIASLGLKIKNGKTYHGLSLNVDIDLSPFRRIDPCGFRGLEMTRMCDWTEQNLACERIARMVAQKLSVHISKK